MKFQLFVAMRYLRSRGKRGVISVATLVSMAGVTAGVLALHIALALNEGIQQEFLARILGATSHISIRSLTSAVIEDYSGLAAQLLNRPQVVSASPAVSGWAMLESRLRDQPGIIKGVDLANRQEYSAVLEGVREGSLENFEGLHPPAIALGKELASMLGVQVGDRLLALGRRGDVSPVGRIPRYRYFQVAAIYETGLWDYDYTLALVSIPSAQQFFGYGPDQASLLEIRLADLQAAGQVAQDLRQQLGASYQVQTWIEINRPLFSALQLEKLALFIAISLIVLVASLNIVSTLTLMVAEKGRDIAIITAMGGSAGTINGIFILQGLVIGTVGTILGTLVGISAALYLDASRLIPLDPQVYQISYIPFRVSGWDVALISLLAVFISFLATLYPARAAARLDPVVALRNE